MDSPYISDCPLCGARRTLAFRHAVLGKHPCEYYYCDACGLLQTQPPYWLEEAYSSAISRLDTGVLARNIRTANILSLLLPLLSGDGDRYLDIAGGYGLLTRLMRDRGFDYYWSDPYCENMFARGFEDAGDGGYAVLTAFEVLEHVGDPVQFLSAAIERAGCRTIVLSTELFQGQPPSPDAWWYYAFGSGQHISFYQARTLGALAGKLGLQCFPGKSIHVFSDQQIPTVPLRLLTSGALAALLSPFVRLKQKSRTMSDHIELSRR